MNKGALSLDEGKLEDVGRITDWMKVRVGSRLKQAELVPA